jgi:hypothetical protein
VAVVARAPGATVAHEDLADPSTARWSRTGGRAANLVATARTRTTNVGVTIGTSLFLIAAGAILQYAVTAHARGVDINTVGVVLMVVGPIGLVLSSYLLVRGRWAAPSPPELP